MKKCGLCGMVGYCDACQSDNLEVLRERIESATKNLNHPRPLWRVSAKREIFDNMFIIKRIMARYNTKE